MNPRTTGILFLIAAALGAFVWFYEIEGEEGRKQAEEREKRLFAGVEPDDVEWLALRTSDDRRVRAERRDGRWQIVEPLAAPGDPFALDAIASAVAQLTSEAVYEEPQGLDVYGLDLEEKEVRFAAGGQEHVLRTGDKTPMGGNAYAWVGGGTSVYTVSSIGVNSLDRAFDDLRDKRILDFDSDGVRGFTASWPGGSVTLARDDAGAWRVTSPVEGAADAETVSALLSGLAFLRADGFEDDPASHQATGLAAPDFAIELELAPAEEGAEPRKLSAEVGRAVDEQRFVRTSQPFLHRIAADRAADFPRRVGAYRFKELAKFAIPDARRVELAFRADDGEATVIEARREEALWKSEPEQMEPDQIESMVRNLAHLKGEDVVTDAAASEDLAGFELDPPNLEVRVYGGGGEEGEETLLGEVRVGAQRGLDGILAQRGDDPAVYLLDYALAEHIPVSLEAFRNRFLAKPEAVEALESEDAPSPLIPGAE